MHFHVKAGRALKRNARSLAVLGLGGVLVATLGAGSAVAAGHPFPDINNVFRSELNTGSGADALYDINNTFKNEIPENQVGTNELNDWAMGDINKVFEPEIQEGAVAGHKGGGVSEIEAGTIGEKDLSDGLRDKIGGDVGHGSVTVASAEIELDGSTDGTVAVQCEEGTAVGGGYELGGNSPSEVTILKTGPVFGDDLVMTGWEVVASPADAGGSTHPTVKAYVLCAS